jgi:hypothetical protein
MVWHRLRSHIFAGIVLAGLAQPFHAQDSGTPPSDPQTVGQTATQTGDKASDNAPTLPVRMARLKFFSGDFEVQRADNTAGDSAALNMPLTEGTRLVTGDYAQAEIEFEDGSVMRLAPRSTVTLDAMTLDARSVAHTQMTMLNGLAYFELRHAKGLAYQVEAGGVAVKPAENAALRIDLPDAGQPTFAVQSGSIVASKPDGFTTLIKAGESLRADPDDADGYFLTQEIAQEPWDDWNQSRDALAAGTADSRTAARDGYAGQQGYGWSDLDANGAWYSAPNDDGSADAVWQPAAAATDDSFDPYADGAFVWSGVQYVWASGYSWGWLPYRCGRWNWYPGLGWVWKPNRFCAVWGFGGDAGNGGILLGARPPRYVRIKRPIPGPIGVHPIIPIHHPAPSQPRPHPAGDVKIAGTSLSPLQPVASVSPSTGFAVGGALSSDFPVASGTRQPVYGTVGSSRLKTGEVQQPAIPGVVLRQEGANGAASRKTPSSSGVPAAPVPEHRAPAPAAPPPAPRAAPAPAPAPAASSSKPK